MAGFGGLGGVGGYNGGASYTMRNGTPSSQHVGTLDEAHKTIWDEYERERAAERRASQSLEKSLYSRYEDVPNMTDAQKEAAVRSLSMTMNNGAQQGNLNTVGFGFQDSPIGDAQTLGYASAWEDRAALDPSFQARADAATADFGQRQLRQQQNYASMLGGNQLNGILSVNYTDPNFGQVSGQGPATIPQIDGVGMDWTAGLGDGLNGGNWAGTFGGQQAQDGVFGTPVARKTWGL